MRFWKRGSRSPAAVAAASATLGDAAHSLRCEHCDVTWRGLSSVPCWCCGAPGAIRGDVRMFVD